MPLTYRWSSRFIFLDEQEARHRLERTRKKWQQKIRPFFDQLFQTQSRSIDQDAMAMVAETEDAIAEAASQLVAYGYYTPVIVLFDDDDARLREKCEAVRRLVTAEGFGARIETLNATEAFLGSLPGNWYANIREPLINTQEPRRPHPAQLGLVRQSHGALSILSNRFSAADAGRQRLDALPFEPPRRRCRPHADFRTDGFRQVDAAGFDRRSVPSLCRRAIFAFDKGRSMLPVTIAAAGDHYEIGGVPEEEGRELGEGTCLLSPVDLSTPGPGMGLGMDRDARRLTGRCDHAGPSQCDRPPGRPDGGGARPVAVGFRVGRPDARDQGRTSPLHRRWADGAAARRRGGRSRARRLPDFEIEELMDMGERNLVPVLTYLFRRIENRLRAPA